MLCLFPQDLLPLPKSTLRSCPVESEDSDAEEEQDVRPSVPLTGSQRTGNIKRTYAELLTSNVDDATLRTTYQGLAGQRHAERAQVLSMLQRKAPSWHMLLR